MKRTRNRSRWRSEEQKLQSDKLRIVLPYLRLTYSSSSVLLRKLGRENVYLLD